MFPANIYLALEGSAIEPFDALIPRTILQLFFLSATITILVTNVYIRAIEKNNQQ